MRSKGNLIDGVNLITFKKTPPVFAIECGEVESKGRKCQASYVGRDPSMQMTVKNFFGISMGCTRQYYPEYEGYLWDLQKGVRLKCLVMSVSLARKR